VKVLPLFTSAYSFKSILTLKEHKRRDNKGKTKEEIAAEKKAEEAAPDNIPTLCIRNKIKKLFLIEDNMAGFLQAHKACGEKLQLIYGLRVNIKEDIKIKDSDTSAKYIIFANNSKGYLKLIEISTFASTEGFDKEPNLDFKNLKKLWSEDLTLAIPFYDSFIFKNSYYFCNCIPDFSFCKPIFFIENNGLYFEDRIRDKVNKYASRNGNEVVEAQSIYYSQKKDFLSWLTYRCIQKRSTLEVPNMDHCCSDQFCVESWKEKNA